jgi:hypothetical protein
MRASAALSDSISPQDLLAAINRLEDRFKNKDGDGAPTTDSAALTHFTSMLDEAPEPRTVIDTMKNYNKRCKFGIKSPDAWQQASTPVTPEERSAALLSAQIASAVSSAIGGAACRSALARGRGRGRGRGGRGGQGAAGAPARTTAPCPRCGHAGHSAVQCYATTHSNGGSV